MKGAPLPGGERRRGQGKEGWCREGETSFSSPPYDVTSNCMMARIALFFAVSTAASGVSAQTWANPFCAQATERNTVTTTLQCQHGVIDSITAFFGVPQGTCPSFSRGSCNDAGFQAYAESACVGKASCTLSSAGTKDPCPEVVKSVRRGAWQKKERRAPFSPSPSVLPMLSPHPLAADAAFLA